MKSTKQNMRASFHLDPEEIEGLYTYFPSIVPLENVSDTAHLKNIMETLLDRIQREQGIALSMQTFLKAAEGDMDALLQEGHHFTPKEQQWLWAIHYCSHYHSDNSLLSKATVVPLRAMFFIFVYFKDSLAIEKLFDTHQEVLAGDYLWSIFCEKHCVEFLLDTLGYKISKEDKNKLFLYAAKKGCTDVVSLLLDCAENELTIETKLLALSASTALDKMDVVKCIERALTVNSSRRFPSSIMPKSQVSDPRSPTLMRFSPHPLVRSETASVEELSLDDFSLDDEKELNRCLRKAL